MIAAVCKMPVGAFPFCAVCVKRASLCPPVNKLYSIYNFLHLTGLQLCTWLSQVWVGKRLYPAMIDLSTSVLKQSKTDWQSAGVQKDRNLKLWISKPSSINLNIFTMVRVGRGLDQLSLHLSSVILCLSLLCFPFQTSSLKGHLTYDF